MKGLTLSSLWNSPWDRDLMQEVYWAKLLGTTPPGEWETQGWSEREIELGCSHASLISQEALQSAPKLKQAVQALVCLCGPVIGCSCPWKGDNLGRGSFLHPGPILGKELSCEPSRDNTSSYWEMSLHQKESIWVSWWLSGKESACQCRRHGFHPWSRKIPLALGQLSLWATKTVSLCCRGRVL